MDTNNTNPNLTPSPLATSYQDSLCEIYDKMQAELKKDSTKLYTSTFNGHEINSLMTLDAMYKLITGKTKAEFDLAGVHA